MKKTTTAIFTIIAITAFSFFSCGGKAKKTESEGNNESVINHDSELNISEIHFDNNWNKAYKTEDKLNEDKFNSLQLGSLSFIQNYNELDYYIGDFIIDSENKKLLTVKAVASGEIAEYLLGYIDNQITDSLLVAYEDNVEYFSTTSSIIERNQITVTTINWDYSGMEEISDTIINKYNITPELTFDEVIEE